MIKNKLAFLSAAFFSFCLQSCGNCDETDLKSGFLNPPREAEPQVWWHWMNGNITKDGIRKDLEWMDAVGIGGIHHFDANIDIKPLVSKRLIYMDEGWKDAFKYAIGVADSLGMQITIASSPGWSATGGPWVRPENAMKKLVWREVSVDGGRKLDMDLPGGYRRAGEFQNFDNGAQKVDFYEDIAVVAVKLSCQEEMVADEVKASSAKGAVDVSVLLDEDPSTSFRLEQGRGDDSAWLLYEFREPETFRAVSLTDGFERKRWSCNPATTHSVLQASDDGKTFRDVVPIPCSTCKRVTLNFPETRARFFRLLVPDSGKGYSDIGEFKLYKVSRVERVEEKAGFCTSCDIPYFRTPECPDSELASPGIDISACVDSTGHLSWDAPQGKWKIFRFGYSLTGKANHPAPPEATGLEVDKLSRTAYTDYFRTYLDMYKVASGGMLGAKGIQYLLTDSYEAHQQTWTPEMDRIFSERRGYDLIPWMPVLTGELLVSAEESDRFLWDWRKSIAELYAENYDAINDVLGEYGMLGRYTESHETARQLVADGMDVKRTAAVPMSATWLDGSHHHFTDIRESASVSHIYGQKFVAAESFTVNGMVGKAYGYCPENIKPCADMSLASGLNRFVIHESSHQPVDDKVPGVGLRKYGQWFNRHETWANLARPWMEYLARSSYMMQQGRNVADVLVYYGEDANLTALYPSEDPAVPDGYNFDYANPTVVRELLEVKDSRLTAGNGTSYAALWLERNNEVMSVDILRKLKKLADKGAVICGPAPVTVASRGDDPLEFGELVENIWGSGRKNVVGSISEALQNVPADWISDVKGLKFVHRVVGKQEFYWVSNTADSTCSANISFKVFGRKPMLWHADSGLIEEVSYSMKDGRTSVILPMTAHDAVFVVFGQKTSVKELTLQEKPEMVSDTVRGPWTVRFQEGRGAPESTVLPQLQSLSENEDPAVRYFSGTATYEMTIVKPQDGCRTILDLGVVCNLAEIVVNGKSAGVLWKSPFRMDISEFLKEGKNAVEIRVTDLWRNRIIGDCQRDDDEDVSYVTWKFFSKDSELIPSGLIGPVRIIHTAG